MPVKASGNLKVGRDAEVKHNKRLAFSRGGSRISKQIILHMTVSCVNFRFLLHRCTYIRVSFHMEALPLT